MKEFNHFVLTRFNVRLNLDTDPKTGLDSEWLNHRFKLFERFCYPSMRGQSNQNFKWIVFFSSQTPDDLKRKIEKYAGWSNFVPIYINEILTGKLIRETLLAYLDDSTKYLITTRLDNDDAVCKNFTQNIQDAFDEQEFEFITFPKGHVIQEDTRRIYSLKYLNNPFISLSEKRHDLTIDGFKTILCIRHTDIVSYRKKIKQISLQPSWLQVVHSKNVSNRIRGIRQTYKDIATHFSIDPEIFETNEPLHSYLFDLTTSLLKFPLESVALELSSDFKKQIKTVLKGSKGRVS